MKLAIDCRCIGKSGIGTYIENIVHELVNGHPEYSYLMICHNEKQIGKHGDNVCVMQTDIEAFSIKELLFFPVKEINQCDAYFTPYFNLPLTINIPIYSTIHDVIFLDRRELTSKFGYYARKFYLWNAVRMSKAIFTVSEFSKNRIRHHFDTDKPIVVTYSAISSAIKEASKSNFPHAATPYIIYVGNIKQHKGLRLLLEGYGIAVSKGFVPDLYIVGNADKFRTSDGEFNSLLQRNPKVKFTGFIPNDELFGLIASAELLVLPSYYEGFGLTPLEALYIGTDALMSDIEVLKEIYGNLPVSFFRCGDECDLADKLMNHSQIVKDTKEIRRRIDNLYNINDIVNKILNTIKAYQHS